MMRGPIHEAIPNDLATVVCSVVDLDSTINAPLPVPREISVQSLMPVPIGRDETTARSQQVVLTGEGSIAIREVRAETLL
jgi:hypothetical protein